MLYGNYDPKLEASQVGANAVCIWRYHLSPSRKNEPTDALSRKADYESVGDQPNIMLPTLQNKLLPAIEACQDLAKTTGTLGGCLRKENPNYTTGLNTVLHLHIGYNCTNKLSILA